MSEWSYPLCRNTPYGGPAPTAMPSPAPGPGARAAMADVRWPNGSTVVVGFLNGTDRWNGMVRDQVKEIAPEWGRYANIKFEFVEGESPHIAINFERNDEIPFYGVYDSYQGTDSLDFSQVGKASMDLVFDPDDPQNIGTEFRRVILHEFGHALGLIHEHIRPDKPIVWNKKAVYAYYQELTGGAWDQTMIDAQVIDPYNRALVEVTEFDPDSIMMYPFPKGLAKYEDGAPFETGWNRELSLDDIAFIGRMYPFSR